MYEKWVVVKCEKNHWWPISVKANILIKPYIQPIKPYIRSEFIGSVNWVFVNRLIPSIYIMFIGLIPVMTFRIRVKILPLIIGLVFNLQSSLHEDNILRFLFHSLFLCGFGKKLEILSESINSHKKIPLGPTLITYTVGVC